MSRAATVSAVAEKPGREMGEDFADYRFVRTGFLRRPWKCMVSATRLLTMPSQYPWTFQRYLQTQEGETYEVGICLAGYLHEHCDLVVLRIRVSSSFYMSCTTCGCMRDV